MYDSIANRFNITILDYNDIPMCYDTTYFYNAATQYSYKLLGNIVEFDDEGPGDGWTFLGWRDDINNGNSESVFISESISNNNDNSSIVDNSSNEDESGEVVESSDVFESESTSETISNVENSENNNNNTSDVDFSGGLGWL